MQETAHLKREEGLGCINLQVCNCEMETVLSFAWILLMQEISNMRASQHAC